MMRGPLRAIAPYDWEAILRLVQESFAYMEEKIDPPSSMHRLTAKAIAEQAQKGEVRVIEEDGAPVACLFLTPRPDALYLGKLAVGHTHRGKGLARRLVEQAETRARALNLPAPAR
jgi:predicted N-acetyltransferase YhbS